MQTTKRTELDIGDSLKTHANAPRPSVQWPWLSSVKERALGHRMDSEFQEIIVTLYERCANYKQGLLHRFHSRFLVIELDAFTLTSFSQLYTALRWRCPGRVVLIAEAGNLCAYSASAEPITMSLQRQIPVRSQSRMMKDILPGRSH